MTAPPSESTSNPTRPLDGVTVLDVTGALAGPYATLLLAGLGARVIKVESPDGTSDPTRRNSPYFGRDGVAAERRHDDDLSVGSLDRSRGKLAVTLDLKHPESTAVFADLVRHCDVMVENWSPGVARRLGVDHESCLAINPRLVYCSITGFGSDEGDGRRAMDTMIQALSGMMMTAGNPGEPPVRSGVPMGDLVAPLFAVIGILSALHQVQRTGQGQQVDVSMLGALTALVATEHVQILEAAGIALRSGNYVPRLAPFGIFEAADGFVAICGPTDPFARGVLAAIGRPELADDERFASRDRRVVNADELHALIAEWMLGRARDEVLAILDQHGVPAAEVRDPVEAITDPQVERVGGTSPVEHPTYGSVDGLLGTGMPIRFSGAHAAHDRPAPFVGQHNDEVYGDLLGYPPERLAALRERGVI
jgi:CoA:oxalate CoA-transferase